MFFKLTSRNAYRDLVRNARRICVADMSEAEKSEAFQELYNMLQQKLDETTRSLNVQPAYAKRCDHWNQRDIAVMKPVKTEKNPWLRFKREFENAIQSENPSRSIQIALAWLYADSYRDDWITT